VGDEDEESGQVEGVHFLGCNKRSTFFFLLFSFLFWNGEVLSCVLEESGEDAVPEAANFLFQ
jgi:hypothetical protein